MSINTISRNLGLALVMSLTLTACFDGDNKKGGGTTAGGSTLAPPVTPPVATPDPKDEAPTISGTPVTAARTDQPYEFQPVATDPDGDVIVFDIVNKPVWATFDRATGKLSGTPSSSATGTFPGISIVASDGLAESVLGPFDITVTSTAASGSATLAWQPPTENVDGTPLTDLAGYVIRYGTTTDALDQVLRVPNPGITSSVVEGLMPATWYFSLSAYNSAGVESAPSPVASKNVT
jgi:hypothetical protein